MRILLGILLFPVIAAYAIIAVFRMHKDDPFKDMDPEKVDALVKISTREAAANPKDAIELRARKLADRGDWQTLSDEMHSAERTLRSSDGTTRDYGWMSFGARSELNDILEQMDPEHCQKKISEITARFEAAANANPNDHMLSTLVARLHLDIGWAWRGDGYADSVTALEWSHMHQHYEAAEKWLARFTEDGITSPYVAHAAHILARHLGDDGRQMRKIYDVWRTLDPGNPNMYAEHAFHLLPRWFGSYQELETEARKAAASTMGTPIGAAPYAWMLQTLIDCEPEALAIVDQEFFLESISDIVRLAPDATGANSILREYSELWLSRGIFETDEQNMQQVRNLAENVCRQVARNHLSAIDLSVWQGKAMSAKNTIAALFGDDIDAGRILDFSSGQLEIRNVPSA